MSRGAKAVIDLAALRHNFQQVKIVSPNTKIVAAIKANAYGHGLVQVASALRDADAFAVATLDEACQLRQAAITHPIVLLAGFFSVDELEVVNENNLQPVIHSFGQIESLLQYEKEAKWHKPIIVWLKIDTGMHRLGLPPNDIVKAYGALSKIPSVDAIVLMTHFACADDIHNDFTHQQFALFNSCTESLVSPISLANSAAILDWPKIQGDWVRPGIMLYGSSPFINKSAQACGLLPVMTLQAKIIARHDIARGDSVGYGNTWVCDRPSCIGTVAIGYGDGYPRHAGSNTVVLLHNKRVPLIGRVSMDLITIDLTNCPEANIGDEVTLWGRGLPVDEIAQCSGTIAYELLTKVTPRVEFVYQD